MGTRGTVAALLLLIAAPAGAAVNVRVNGEQVQITARDASVSDVLDALSGRIQMKVVYDGPAPQSSLALRVTAHTPAEAVLAVLQGLGLSYVLAFDATGRWVRTLMDFTRTATSSRAPAGRQPSGGEGRRQAIMKRLQAERLAAAAREPEPEPEPEQPGGLPADSFVDAVGAATPDTAAPPAAGVPATPRGAGGSFPHSPFAPDARVLVPPMPVSTPSPVPQ